MSALPRLNEDDLDLLINYSVSSDEEMIMGIINAFQAANIDVYEKPTLLCDWINTDVLNLLQWSAKQTYLSTQIWDHQVVITGREIRIYT